MLRWNGWGDEAIHLELPEPGRDLLIRELGIGNARPDASLNNLLKCIPDSRLLRHPMTTFDPRERLDHAHGQSLPDWIGLRGGSLKTFPDGVAYPESCEQVTDLIRFAKKQDADVIPCGGGTSVVGHLAVPEGDRPVLSLSLKRMNRLIDLNPDNLLATFESGILGSQLEVRLKAKGFTLGHYPQSFEYSTLGGWVATRSSGQQSSHYGRIEQLYAGGELVTPVGTLTLPPFPASAAGPDLRQMVLGSEGRLGVLTRVTVRVLPIPERDDIYGVFFPSWDHAATAVRTIAGAGIPYSMIRLSNPVETRTGLALAGHSKKIGLLSRYLRIRGVAEDSTCMCLIGFTGSRHRVRSARREAVTVLRRYKGISVGKAPGENWKKNRFRAPYLRNTLWNLGYAVDTLETAVTWDKVDTAMEMIERVVGESLMSWNEKVHCFSHLSHVYPSGSSVYTTFVFRLANTPEETLARWQAIKKAASRAIIRTGGTISHQHGVGVDHLPYMAVEKGPAGVGALKQLCAYFDPENRMNPGKLVT